MSLFFLSFVIFHYMGKEISKSSKSWHEKWLTPIKINFNRRRYSFYTWQTS